MHAICRRARYPTLSRWCDVRREIQCGSGTNCTEIADSGFNRARCSQMHRLLIQMQKHQRAEEEEAAAVARGKGGAEVPA